MPAPAAALVGPRDSELNSLMSSTHRVPGPSVWVGGLPQFAGKTPKQSSGAAGPLPRPTPNL